MHLSELIHDMHGKVQNSLPLILYSDNWQSVQMWGAFAGKWFVSPDPPPSAPAVTDAPGLPFKPLTATAPSQPILFLCSWSGWSKLWAIQPAQKTSKKAPTTRFSRVRGSSTYALPAVVAPPWFLHGRPLRVGRSCAGKNPLCHSSHAFA